MNLKELRWPVRVYWDLPADPDPTLAGRISEELILLKVLFLSLRSPGAGACSGVLAAVKDGPPAVSLTLPGPALTAAVLPSLEGAGVRSLLAEFASLLQAGQWLAGEAGSGGRGAVSGIAFDLRGSNYHEIPDIVSLCLRSGLRDLVFPIQRLTAEGEVFCLTQEMRAGLSAGLAGMDYSPLRITIHDPFLWQVFFPAVPYHEGGCQAANSMLYISPGFKVYPCPAMPLELGDLRLTTLREIIRSQKKQDLRRTLQTVPSDCSACALSVKCVGGCRGRALAAAGSLDRMDPAC